MTSQTYQSFEQLPVWQSARSLVKKVYTLTLQGALAKDFGLRDQIQRASVSIMNNTAEGFERNSKKEFIQFLGIAKGSAGEVRSILILAQDLNYISQEDLEEMKHRCESLSKQLYGLMRYLRSNRLNNTNTKK